MIITEEKLQKILKMVAIDITTVDRREIVRELNQMIKWVEKIKEVNVDGASAFTTMSRECNRFSDGAPTPPLGIQEVLINAPKHDGAYFCVPPTEVQTSEAP